VCEEVVLCETATFETLEINQLTEWKSMKVVPT